MATCVVCEEDSSTTESFEDLVSSEDVVSVDHSSSEQTEKRVELATSSEERCESDDPVYRASTTMGAENQAQSLITNKKRYESRLRKPKPVSYKSAVLEAKHIMSLPLMPSRQSHKIKGSTEDRFMDLFPVGSDEEFEDMEQAIDNLAEGAEDELDFVEEFFSREVAICSSKDSFESQEMQDQLICGGSEPLVRASDSEADPSADRPLVNNNNRRRQTSATGLGPFRCDEEGWRQSSRQLAREPTRSYRRIDDDRRHSTDQRTRSSHMTLQERRSRWDEQWISGTAGVDRRQSRGRHREGAARPNNLAKYTPEYVDRRLDQMLREAWMNLLGDTYGCPSRASGLIVDHIGLEKKPPPSPRSRDSSLTRHTSVRSRRNSGSKSASPRGSGYRAIRPISPPRRQHRDYEPYTRIRTPTRYSSSALSTEDTARRRLSTGASIANGKRERDRSLQYASSSRNTTDWLVFDDGDDGEPFREPRSSRIPVSRTSSRNH